MSTGGGPACSSFQSWGLFVQFPEGSDIVPSLPRLTGCSTYPTIRMGTPFLILLSFSAIIFLTWHPPPVPHSFFQSEGLDAYYLLFYLFPDYFATHFFEHVCDPSKVLNPPLLIYHFVEFPPFYFSVVWYMLAPSELIFSFPPLQV